MKRPKRSDFKNCRDPDFAYIYAMGIYHAWRTAKNNPLIKFFNKLDSDRESKE